MIISTYKRKVVWLWFIYYNYLVFIYIKLGDTYIEKLKIWVKFTIPDIPDLLKGLDINCSKIHKRVIRIFRWIIEYQSNFK